MINSEKKPLLTILYCGVLLLGVSFFFFSETPPLTLYFFDSLMFIGISVFGIIIFKGLKTYSHGNKMFVFIVTSIILSIIIVGPLFKSILDLSQGVTIKNCKVVNSADYDYFKNKAATDLTVLVDYVCEDKSEMEQTYYITLGSFFSKFSDSNKFVEGIRSGDKHEIKYYKHSNSIVSVKNVKENFINSIGYMDILLILLFIINIFVVINIKKDDYDTIRKITSMHKIYY